MKTALILPVVAALVFGGCSSFKNSQGKDQMAQVESNASVYMQVKKGGGNAPVYKDMYLSKEFGGVGEGMPLIRDLTKTLSNGVLVMRVNVRGGTLANQELWIKATDVEPRNAAAVAALRQEAENLAEQARNSGRQAEAWEAAANTARFLCISGVGAGGALSFLNLGVAAVGKTALVALIGANTVKPLLDCAGVDVSTWGI